MSLMPTDDDLPYESEPPWMDDSITGAGEQRSASGRQESLVSGQCGRGLGRRGGVVSNDWLRRNRFESD